MKTKLELIKNYPIEDLKNWGEYDGYSRSHLQKMADMVSSTFNWQAAKIAVLDDFAFQLTNFLIEKKNVPLQNIYFLVSEEDENRAEVMKKWYSALLENEVLSCYHIVKDVSFDLIITNKVGRKIINILQPLAQEVVVL